MSNVIYGQYDSKEYPLKKFYYEEIPPDIKKVLSCLNRTKVAFFRGGLAYVLLLKKNQYLLKDLDMIALENEREKILDVLIEADIIFVNKNTFGDKVITAFWKSENEYYKLDILLSCKLPYICEKMVGNQRVSVVSVSYIWKDRVEKIAEKEIRHHDKKKTLNHYKVANELGKYLLNHKNEIIAEDMKEVYSKLSDVEMVLSRIIPVSDLEKFMSIQYELVRR